MISVRKALYASAVVLSAALIACEKERPQAEVSDCVPTDVEWAAMVDLDHLLKMAGCSAHGGRIELSAEVSACLDKFLGEDCREVVEAAASEGDIADLSKVYAFALQDHTFVIVAAPKEGEHPAPGSLESPQARRPAFRSGVLWYGVSPSIADSVASLALQHPLSQEPVAQEAFGGEGQLRMLLHLGRSVKNPVGDDFNSLIANVSFTDRAIKAKARAANGAGMVNAASNMLKINENMALTMPADPAVSLVAGLDKKAMDGLISTLKPKGAGADIAASMLQAVLAKDGGTVGAALLPGGNAETISKFSLDNWLCKAVVPINEDSHSVAKMASRYLDGLWASVSPEGYIITSSYDPEEAGDDEWRAAIEPNECLQLEAIVGYKSELMKALRLHSGWALEAVCDDKGQAQASLTMMGPSAYILPALLSEIQQLK